MKPLLTVQHEGKTLTVPDLAKMTGLKRTTIRTRLYAGWDAARILSEPAAAKVVGASKNDAEMELNETPLDRIPESLREVATGITRKQWETPQPRYGTVLRQYHRKIFDAWYHLEYLESKKLKP